MTENKKPTSPTPDPGQAADFAARRTVVRGLASVPVILTLGNGAAQANASSYQCVTRATDEGLEDPGCQQPFNLDNPPTGMDSEGRDLGKFAWEGVPPTDSDYWCVAYAKQNGRGNVRTEGVGWWVDQHGNLHAPRSANAHPLLASCLSSFV